jgi:hypothetical protein
MALRNVSFNAKFSGGIFPQVPLIQQTLGLFKYIGFEYFAPASSSPLNEKCLGAAGSELIHRSNNTAFGYAKCVFVYRSGGMLRNQPIGP